MYYEFAFYWSILKSDSFNKDWCNQFCTFYIVIKIESFFGDDLVLLAIFLGKLVSNCFLTIIIDMFHMRR